MYETIFELFRELRNKHPNQVMTVVMHDLAKKHAMVPKGMHVSTNSTTFFFRVAQENGSSNFAKALDRFKEGRQVIGGAAPHMQALHEQIKSFTLRNS